MRRALFGLLACLCASARPVIARIVATGLRQCRTDNDTSTPPTVGCIN